MVEEVHLEGSAKMVSPHDKSGLCSVKSLVIFLEYNIPWKDLLMILG